MASADTTHEGAYEAQYEETYGPSDKASYVGASVASAEASAEATDEGTSDETYVASDESPSEVTSDAEDVPSDVASADESYEPSHDQAYDATDEAPGEASAEAAYGALSADTYDTSDGAPSEGASEASDDALDVDTYEGSDADAHEPSDGAPSTGEHVRSDEASSAGDDEVSSLISSAGEDVTSRAASDVASAGVDGAAPYGAAGGRTYGALDVTRFLSALSPGFSPGHADPSVGPALEDSRQSFRLTRNGFTVRPNGRLFLAKIGDVRVRWSRELPSSPSSVTIIREPDGHFYASFVVEVEPTPLPAISQECGVDPGITRLATVATSCGGRIDVLNPKHLARKPRKPRRLEREKSRRAKGGANRVKTRRKVAVRHGKVTRARRDYHHKQALTLIRENQAVYVEDLHVAGMVRNRSLARAISDAGFGQLVRTLEEKAKRYGRTVAKTDRWFPSSKLCSTRGALQESMPLSVRSWTCLCGATHDRDHNAAINILDAGRAERLNARGADVSPPLGMAVGDEAGTTPDAA